MDSQRVFAWVGTAAVAGTATVVGTATVAEPGDASLWQGLA